MPRAAELNGRVAQALSLQPLAHWEALLRERDVLFARVGHARELLANEQCVQAGVFGRLAHAGIGELPWANLPGMAGTARPAGEAPALGQHTEAVLSAFGIRA
ncbi:CoA transferase [Cupriavidus necator]|uniref:CoA transferase n=1 Tax=Cupriavidus necator TaxID=106590 RepID=UPI00339D5E81